MPASKRPKPLYQRGKFRLYPAREDRTNLDIVWYDDERKRERSTSAGTADHEEGKIAVDRLYLSSAGSRICPTCHRPWDHEKSPTAAAAIADYLLLIEGKAGEDAAIHRLKQITAYIAETNPDVVCAEIDENWIERFRKWALARPVVSPKGRVLRERSLAHVEGGVMQLAAAINATPGQQAQFKAQQQVAVTRSPSYRADVKMLAAMFRHAMEEDFRINLLRYLQLATATWARPETVLAVKRDQWHPDPRVLDLNPARRQRTNKHLPTVPVPRQIVPLLNAMEDNWIPANTVRASWDKMRVKLGLPSDRQAGPKLIRRSMATLVRRRIGEANWRQGEIMLGHVQFAISDIYAIPDPANLGLALGATEDIIDEIEKLAPGAFYRTSTAKPAIFSVVKGGING